MGASSVSQLNRCGISSINLAVLPACERFTGAERLHADARQLSDR